jgi:hypothetical protein
MFFSSFAHAESSYLTVRHLDSQDYEAVLTIDVRICVEVGDVVSVDVSDLNVRIESAWREQVPCIIVPPVNSHEVTAYIGPLAPGEFIVTWDQPEAISQSIIYEVDGHSPIPSSSFWSLLLLTLGVVAVGRLALKTRHSIAPG